MSVNRDGISGLFPAAPCSLFLQLAERLKEDSGLPGLRSNCSNRKEWDMFIYLENAGANDEVRSALANTEEVLGGYLRKTLEMRTDVGIGSTYDSISPDELLSQIKNADWKEVSHENVLPGCKAYVTTDIPDGRYGLVNISDLPDGTMLLAEDPKETGAVSMAVAGIPGKKTKETFLITGKDDDGERTVVYTFHPGEPVRPSIVSTEKVMDGTPVTKEQAVSMGFNLAKVDRHAQQKIAEYNKIMEMKEAGRSYDNADAERFANSLEGRPTLAVQNLMLDTFGTKKVRYIPDPAPSVMLRAVKKNVLAINGFKNPDRETQLYVLKEDPTMARSIERLDDEAKKYIESLDKDTKRSIVKELRKHGGSRELLDVMLQSGDRDVIKELVSNFPRMIKDIKDPDREMIESAVKNGGISFIDNPDRELQMMAVNRENRRGHDIIKIKEPYEEVQLAAVRQDPHVIEYIKNPCKEAQLEAIKLDKNAFIKIHNPDKDVSAEVLKMDPAFLITIKEPTEEHVRIVCSSLESDPRNLLYIHNNQKAMDIIDKSEEFSAVIENAENRLYDTLAEQGLLYRDEHTVVIAGDFPEATDYLDSPSMNMFDLKEIGLNKPAMYALDMFRKDTNIYIIRPSHHESSREGYSLNIYDRNEVERMSERRLISSNLKVLNKEDLSKDEIDMWNRMDLEVGDDGKYNEKYDCDAVCLPGESTIFYAGTDRIVRAPYSKESMNRIADKMEEIILRRADGVGRSELAESLQYMRQGLGKLENYCISKDIEKGIAVPSRDGKSLE